MRQLHHDHPGILLLSTAAAGCLLALAAGTGVNLWRSAADRQAESKALTGGNAAHAPLLLRRYGCAGCHDIPGVPGADGKVGGSLANLRARIYIAGVTTNTPEHLTAWIVNPQAFSPRSAMPATGITPGEARDVTAYLYGL